MLSGTIRADDVLVNSRSGAKERLHNLISLTGNSQTHVDSVGAGDIVAVTKLSDTRTGDTLAPDGTPVTVVLPTLPRPVYGVAIAAAKQSDEDRLATALHRLLAEDPTLAVHHDDSTGQTVLSGGGETHVRVALSRIAHAGVELEVDDVRVAYRATLAAPTEVEGKHKKQSGGHGQFGVATVRFEPLPAGAGFEFDERGDRWRRSRRIWSPRSVPASRRRWREAGVTGFRSSTYVRCAPAASTTRSTRPR